MASSAASHELPGLSVRLDRLVYRAADPARSGGRRHSFIYFLTILNQSSVTVTLLGRKWVIEHDDGERLVVEGDKIVGETPTLEPGGSFSYNSFHLTNTGGSATGSFHGLDEHGQRIHVRIPRFELHPPEE
jgi:ApaG protein